MIVDTHNYSKNNFHNCDRLSISESEYLFMQVWQYNGYIHHDAKGESYINHWPSEYFTIIRAQWARIIVKYSEAEASHALFSVTYKSHVTIEPVFILAKWLCIMYAVYS